MNLSGSLGFSGLLRRDDFVPIEPLATVAPAPVRGQTRHDGAGLPTLVIYAHFILWALEQREFPTTTQVRRRFNCSKSTANRWLNYLAEAQGVARRAQYHEAEAQR